MITFQGLKPMGRMHIHFAPGEPGHHEVISGNFFCVSFSFFHASVTYK